MDNELLENIFITNNYSHETRKVNRSVMKKYCEFYGMNLQELLDEAEKDEADNVKWKHRRVKHKLLKYRQFLLDKYSINTVRIHMSVVSKFYRFYDIEINPLPRLNMKAVKKPTPIYYKDLPDKEIIREALAISPPVMKAIILFSCSSGCARAETLSLTIQDYIDALSEYLPNKRMNIYQIIDYLNDNDNVIPTFNLRRIKTNKY